jgi:hypothetical protein
MERATKAVASAGLRARIVMDLDARRIEIIIGESPEAEPPPGEWGDDDV